VLFGAPFFILSNHPIPAKAGPPLLFKGGETIDSYILSLSSFLKEEYPEGGRWLALK